MNILLVGASKEPAIEQYFLKHLKELGAKANLLPIQDVFFEYYEKNIFNKVMFRTKLSSIYKKLNDLFKAEVERQKPDVIWIFKGMELFPSTLTWARDKKIKLVNYNPDNPFFFSGRGSGNSNVIESIGLYDLHFAYDPAVRDRIIREYKIDCSLLPFGFEEDEALYQRCRQQEEQVQLCFVGSPDRERIIFLQEIAQKVPLAIYGPTWDKYIQHKNISIFDAVHGEAFWKALHRYRIQLNRLRPHNPNAHNMRSFEVPVIGGIMLAPDTPDHRLYFQENKEIFLYKNAGECIDRVNDLLRMDKQAADQVRTNARLRSMNSGYSYYERTKLALSNLEQLLCKS